MIKKHLCLVMLLGRPEVVQAHSLPKLLLQTKRLKPPITPLIILPPLLQPKNGYQTLRPFLKVVLLPTRSLCQSVQWEAKNTITKKKIAQIVLKFSTRKQEKLPAILALTTVSVRLGAKEIVKKSGKNKYDFPLHQLFA